MLLGLAVWKAECLWKMPKDSSVHDATVWIESGWKKCKGEQLSSNAIPVIVRAVGPFLGYPTLADIFDDRKTRRSRTFYLHNL
jgi:hypothetical protein